MSFMIILFDISGPEYTRPYRALYFNAMSGFNQRAVLTAILRNQSIATRTPTAFKTSSYTRSSQSGDSAMDQHGVLFFGLLSDQSIGCWHIGKKFDQRNVVTLAKNDTTLQFPVSLVVSFMQYIHELMLIEFFRFLPFYCEYV
jgi:hypothetical protein